MRRTNAMLESVKSWLHSRRLRSADLGSGVPEFGKLEGRTIRVLGIDTPEVRTRDPTEKAAGIRARNYVAAWALPDRFEVDGAYDEAQLKRAYAETPVMLDVDFRGTEKFGRATADVYRAGSASSIGDLLIANGHAVEYDGGTKPAFRGQA